MNGLVVQQRNNGSSPARSSCYPPPPPLLFPLLLFFLSLYSSSVCCPLLRDAESLLSLQASAAPVKVFEWMLDYFSMHRDAEKQRGSSASNPSFPPPPPLSPCDPRSSSPSQRSLLRKSQPRPLCASSCKYHQFPYCSSFSLLFNDFQTWFLSPGKHK